MPRRGRPPLSASGERSRDRPSTRTHLPPPETLDQARPSESQGLREQVASLTETTRLQGEYIQRLWDMWAQQTGTAPRVPEQPAPLSTGQTTTTVPTSPIGTTSTPPTMQTAPPETVTVAPTTAPDWEGRCRRRPYPLGTAVCSSHVLLWSPFSGTGTSSVERAIVLSVGLAQARANCLYLILGVTLELCSLLLVSWETLSVRRSVSVPQSSAANSGRDINPQLSSLLLSKASFEIHKTSFHRKEEEKKIKIFKLEILSEENSREKEKLTTLPLKHQHKG
uniref:Uncharacterized protein n=1 Tax=Ananas comosus var. bracteatus TaxID=296719 RepID=A0A6V7Q252_ANACO|nr:unnamed protein product [Ananas comosus var. bracteatus]